MKNSSAFRFPVLVAVLAVLVSCGGVWSYHTHAGSWSSDSLSPDREDHTPFPSAARGECLLCQMARGSGKILTVRMDARTIPMPSVAAPAPSYGNPAFRRAVFVPKSRAPPYSVSL